MNDDLIKPMNGFTTHPHRHMEIFTYIVEGYLTHKDSTKNEETLTRGDIQFMSAGNGVQHSEMNNDNYHKVRCVQTWIIPNNKKYKIKKKSQKRKIQCH